MDTDHQLLSWNQSTVMSVRTIDIWIGHWTHRAKCPHLDCQRTAIGDYDRKGRWIVMACEHYVGWHDNGSAGTTFLFTPPRKPL